MARLASSKQSLVDLETSLETVKVKSPVDGSIYAERPIATEQAINAAVERAKAAQEKWAETPIVERGKYMLAMLEALIAMTDEIVPEIAWQMGRPVRYGGEFGGVRERTNYMVEIAEAATALAETSGKPLADALT
ncbi:MAG: aldehyde dehydrogenase family protein, partial [Mesorhizobium sp.]